MKGKKGIVTKDVHSANGMLHKKSKVTVVEVKCTCTHGDQNILVQDSSGRDFWIGKHDFLIS